MSPMRFSDAEYAGKRKQTRREVLLKEKMTGASAESHWAMTFVRVLASLPTATGTAAATH